MHLKANIELWAEQLYSRHQNVRKTQASGDFIIYPHWATSIARYLILDSVVFLGLHRRKVVKFTKNLASDSKSKSGLKDQFTSMLKEQKILITLDGLCERCLLVSENVKAFSQKILLLVPSPRLD